jgi:hypothetical protein
VQQPSLDGESESENQYNHGESDITQLWQFYGLRNGRANNVVCAIGGSRPRINDGSLLFLQHMLVY